MNGNDCIEVCEKNDSTKEEHNAILAGYFNYTSDGYLEIDIKAYRRSTERI